MLSGDSLSTPVDISVDGVWEPPAGDVDKVVSVCGNYDFCLPKSAIYQHKHLSTDVGGK